MESEVHSHNSSCIYSIENQMGTLSSSSCQLRLGVDLSHLGWSLTLVEFPIILVYYFYNFCLVYVLLSHGHMSFSGMFYNHIVLSCDMVYSSFPCYL